MAHLLSNIFFLAVLIGLAVLLERELRSNGAAIRGALLRTRIGFRTEPLVRILGRIGMCLRVSFPAQDQDSSELARLLLPLNSRPWPRD